MFKKALIAGAVLAAAAGAQAATVTSPAGVGFSVTAVCNVQGNVLNVGSYTASQTLAAVAARQGRLDGDSGAITAGTDAAGTLATVNCGNGVPWVLHLDGAGPSGTTLVKNPSGATFYNAMPYATAVNATAIGGTQLHAIGPGLSFTATGVDQVVLGHYLVYTVPGGSAVLNTPLTQGTNIGTNTARLDF